MIGRGGEADARRADEGDLGLTAPPPARRGPDWPVVVIAVALGAVAALVASEAMRVSARRVYGLSPGGVPYVIAGGLGVLALLILVQGLRGNFPERDRDAPGPVLWIVAGLVLQIALLRHAGFSIATGLVFAFTARAMGRGPLWATIPLGMVGCFAIWLVFAQLLNLSLPAGPPEQLYLDLTAPAPPPPAAPGPATGPATVPAPAAP